MRLATQTHGDGPRRIVLVHGLGGDGSMWRGFTERIVATGQATVTTLDLRGHGESDRSDVYTVDAFADDLVDTLPTDLDLIVGHSLGGTVLERAVGRLRPRHALYLDPGFRLKLPTKGLAGRLFWVAAPVTLTLAALSQKRRSRGRPPLTPQDASLRDAALARFDRQMAVGVFRDVAHHPAPVTAPIVPSTIVLSDDAPAVLPDATAERLADLGWDVRRLPGVGHDFWLQDPVSTTEAVRDLIVGNVRSKDH
jgi:pimeloyl-ACP methyl ester carboxylesterase